MSITIRLKSEIEAQLIARATAQGVSVEELLERMIESSITSDLKRQKPVGEAAKTWEAVLHELGKSPSLAKAVSLSDEAISRESIYREREDSQL